MATTGNTNSIVIASGSHVDPKPKWDYNAGRVHDLKQQRKTPYSAEYPRWQIRLTGSYVNLAIFNALIVPNPKKQVYTPNHTHTAYKSTPGYATSTVKSNYFRLILCVICCRILLITNRLANFNVPFYTILISA